MKPTPRMMEIAGRANRALEAVRDNRTDRDAIVKEFHRHSMEDVLYLLGKCGVDLNKKKAQDP